jgi:Domain of unknown function (DUF4266)
MKKIIVFVFSAMLIVGCTSVKPWERGVLAEPAMQSNPYPIESFMNEHIYFSKEAATGGNSLSGGGCGCN